MVEDASRQEKERSESEKIVFRLEKDADGYPPDDYESLWADKRGESLYIVDNIPFFVRDVSPGDIVRVKEVGGRFYFDGVEEKSLNSVLRVIAYDASIVPTLRVELKALGADSELSHIPNLVAVEVPEDAQLDAVLGYLEHGEIRGEWEYETASLRT